MRHNSLPTVALIIILALGAAFYWTIYVNDRAAATDRKPTPAAARK